MKQLLFLLLVLAVVAGPQLPLKPIGAAVGSGKRIALKSTAATAGQNVRRINLNGVQFTDGRFSFSLDTSSITSTGVYRLPDTVLVRTLWSGIRYPAGLSVGQWDGLDDYGAAVPAGSYIVKVLSNNVRYDWEGVIGNSSFLLGNTANAHRGYQFIRKLVEVGNYVYYNLHYVEGSSPIAKFAKAAPQSKVDIFPNGYGSGTGSEHIATDGVRVYFANYDRLGADHQNKTWVAALTASTDAAYTFSSGGSYKPNQSVYSESTAGLILSDSTSNLITGLAVQKSGSALLVAYAGKNQIRVFNKLTGAQTATLSVSNPRGLLVDGSDNIWILSGSNSVSRHTLSGSALSAASLSLSGLVAPLTMALSPDGATLAVADGGSSQQVKGFSTASGSASWTLGQAGGYSTTSTVSADRFYFSDLSGGVGDAGLCFVADGGLWVTDQGNYRVQHFDASRAFVDNISYISASYTSAVDANDPTRVFDQYLEYGIDYSKPLASGWSLKRNWRAQAPANFFRLDNKNQNVDMFGVFSNVVTLSNGRTYAFCKRYADNQQVLVELVSGGVMRVTSLVFAPPVNLLADGSLNYTIRSGAVIAWKRRALTGFDASNNPVWGGAVTESNAPVSAIDPVDPTGYGDGRAGQRTSTGKIVTFQDVLTRMMSGTVYGLGYHLGFVKAGATAWQARTAMATSGPAYRGDYPADAYDVGNHANFRTGDQIGYGGGAVTVTGRHVFWNYYGEFWKDSQTNKWHHVYDNGLMLGSWGPTGRDNPGSRDTPGMAGGVHYGTAVLVNGVIYIYHAEEGGFSGLHRWRVSNLGSIREQIAVSIPVVANRSFLALIRTGTDLLAGLPRTDTLDAAVAGWSFTGTPDWSAEFGGSFWALKTSARSYDRFASPDLWIQFTKDNQTYTVARELPVTGSVASWSLTGLLNLIGGWGNDGQPWDATSGGWYADVLDHTRKVIIRFYSQRDGSVSPSRARLFVNSTALVVTNEFGGELTKLSSNQPLSIGRSGGTLQFSFAGYSATNVAVFEAGADNTRPTTLRFTFWDKGVKRDRYVNVQKLSFTSAN